MRDKVLILTLNADYISLDEWQQKYGLPVGSDQIGKYFNINESRFVRDIQEFGKLIVCEPLMIVLDEYRRITGVPTHISSFNRDDGKQLELIAEEEKENRRRKLLDPNYKPLNLRASVSPHVFKMAADIDVTTKVDVIARVPLLKQAAVNKNVMLRVGYKEYLKKHDELAAEGKPDQWTFIHGDVCPEYFKKGRVWHNRPHPVSWEVETEW